MDKVKLEARVIAMESGRQLASPSKGDEVVISGIAGSFPDSNDVTALQENLFNKVDLISDDDSRWSLNHPEIPIRTGKVRMVEKFDAAFFGIHYKEAHEMDPMTRIVLEKSYEAVIDAGFNPTKLRGNRTGVFIGACFSESEKVWFFQKSPVKGFGVVSCSRSALATMISYWLGINGPSSVVDSACSSSLYALEQAYRAIREDQCDSALVGGCNLCLHPYVSLQFSRLGVLSMDGRCKSLDDSANGYCRSEAVSVIYLQKAKDARRIYATVIHTKSNCDGFKEEGITFPSGAQQQRLLQEIYDECQVVPSTVGWLEAHATGTKVGDPEEVKAMENVFCANRKGPLLMGSVKSNLGHAEPSSGLCSVAKVIISMETGFIPPNINLNTLRKDIDAFHNGKIKVVTEKTPWNGGLVGINSFGFGGANCHVLLKWNEKSKVNGGAPSDDIPRIVPVSGRTEEAVTKMLNFVQSRHLDVEFVKLLHEIHADKIPGHIFKGFSVVDNNSTAIVQSVKVCPTEKRPIWFVFSGLWLQWEGIGQSLMKIPVFASTIRQIDQFINTKGLNVVKIITDSSKSITENIINEYVGITAIQIGLVDVLTATGIKPDYMIGLSVGELVCAYADGCLSLEQTIMGAYFCGLVFQEAQITTGIVAEIGMGYHKIKKVLPADVDVVCHYSAHSCVISGPSAIVRHFTADLQKQDIHTQEISSSSITQHSRYAASAKLKLLSYLKQVIPNKPRSSRWISSSFPEEDWDTSQAKLCSAIYFTNNLLSPVLFEEASKDTSYSIVVQFLPHSLHHLQHNNIPLMQSESSDKSVDLVTALGILFVAGENPKFSALYPEVSLPVSRGTPMISPLVRWHHTQNWRFCKYNNKEKIKSGERRISVNLKDDDYEYLGGHVIDGRNLFPATGYLALIWQTICLLRGDIFPDMPVVFEDVRFHRATNMPKNLSLDFITMTQKGSGRFEINEGGATIVTGRVFVPDNVSEEMLTVDSIDHRKDSDDLELSSRDFYKELRLRGYNYKGLFRSVTRASNTGTVGQIQWHNNWVAFMDNILQMQIISEDTRGLFVPTYIKKLVIDVETQRELLASIPDGEQPKELPVYVYRDFDLIKAGGVQIKGLSANSINRKRQVGEPVLEKYCFYPYKSQEQDSDLNTFVRMIVQLVIENEAVIQVKTVELLDDRCHCEADLVSPALLEALGGLPLVKADVNILTAPGNEKTADLGPNINVSDINISKDQSAMILVASELLTDSREEIFKQCLGDVKDNGYILARHKMDDNVKVPDGFVICLEREIGHEKLVLIKKVFPFTSRSVISIHLMSNNFDWIPKVQTALKKDNEIKKIILYAQKDYTNGILGLVNCLQREVGGKLSCVFVMDQNAPEFSTEVDIYRDQLSKNMAINVLKDGVWGSYRHLPINLFEPAPLEYAFCNTTIKGDLSSLTWLQAPPLQVDTENGCTLVQIYYSTLNFRDVMVLTGKLAAENFIRLRLQQDCVCGFEFSGRTQSGRRVMGISSSKCLSNQVIANPFEIWDVPDTWTLEEAASVPVVYTTVVQAIIMVGKIKRGESILIHAGSGGVGQAAINVALSYGCTIFTTVGTPEKQQFIRKTFPQIKESHIGNSRDCSFEQMVMVETCGRGVDLVLNSLSEEKLIASVRCLARGGRFIEIGKFDLVNNNPLGMNLFLNETSFHGVILDTPVIGETSDAQRKLHARVDEGIKNGVIKPLCRTIFCEDDVEGAVRYMAGGKHIGKILIKIREEEDNRKAIPPPKLMTGKKRFFCKGESSYIIIGGLGGFGLELADWLVLKGCKQLILVSRSGLRTGYQAMRIRIWKGYGVTVEISTADITTEQGAIDLLNQANKLGPVDAIFNLAAVLKDALFENQSEEDFRISLGPKAEATMHLDKQSRRLCLELQHFVVFSSVSCGRGNAGQTNYGLGNSVMERVCELRKSEGFPALAIQWGAIGEVGLVAEMQEEHIEVVIGGTLQQRINSCLDVMDGFMLCEHPVVASMVVAEKRSGSGGADNIVDVVLNILGLKDLKGISLHSTLAELGMDSMMAVEIKQTLEREFQVFLTPQDIRGMTFAKLQSLGGQAETDSKLKSSENLPITDFTIKQILRFVGEEETSKFPILRVPSLYKDGNIESDVPDADNPILLIPGIDGVASVMEPLAKNLHCAVYCLQYDRESPEMSIGEIADRLILDIQKVLKGRNSFKIVGYSFGAMVALEIVYRLEREGKRGVLWLIDGAPDFLQGLTRKWAQVDGDLNSGLSYLQINILVAFVHTLSPENTLQTEKELIKLTTWEDMVNHLVDRNSELHHSKGFQRLTINAIYNRLLAILRYTSKLDGSIASKTTLIRPSQNATIIEEDYGISKYCMQPISVHFVEGDHLTILDNLETAELINGTAKQE